MKKVSIHKPTPKPVGGRTALLVIDVQRGLFNKSTPIYKEKELLKNINMLVERARADVPVVYVQHSAEKQLVKGTPDWQLHSQLHPLPEDGAVHKLHGNAFEDTPLEEMLQAQNISTVVVTGMVTHGCVKATCLGARSLGYRVILVKDAHSNFSKDAARQIDKVHQALSAEGADCEAAAEIALAAEAMRKGATTQWAK